MSAGFQVFVTAHFERLYRRLLGQQPDLEGIYAHVIAVLGVDPFNRTHRYPIRKLQGVSEGDGQYRIRSGRFRFRYDVQGNCVYLKTCGLRREDTYS